MKVRQPALSLAVSLLLLSPVAFASVHGHHHGSAHAITRRSAASHAARPVHMVERTSYNTISSERTTQIQSALIQQGYLTGEPTGSWDGSTIAALQKLQADNHWQSKLVPDSRALIKLGLGPGSEPAAAPVTSAALNPAATPQTAAGADQTF